MMKKEVYPSGECGFGMLYACKTCERYYKSWCLKLKNKTTILCLNFPSRSLFVLTSHFPSQRVLIWALQQHLPTHPLPISRHPLLSEERLSLGLTGSFSIFKPLLLRTPWHRHLEDYSHTLSEYSMLTKCRDLNKSFTSLVYGQRLSGIRSPLSGIYSDHFVTRNTL